MAEQPKGRLKYQSAILASIWPAMRSDIALIRGVRSRGVGFG